ncbi:succinic semialdehyde dehydrogenase [Tsukamurella sp. 8F]|uniref:succinic semialdehyde dehydrogenase n=1 Tax=unclassified Tsukamurella TaxID=2633480 RepID=UPI0023B9D252|nr:MULTISPECIES: succinic semialdehyde dehydrogenase [unclassified Tsukamurella]MDF0530603.1 succinic semialdehyde dehydrogenase [Tsukamurella sp. 8J]MDF0587804.1 succinic semialdehyde dehydrogenase [Tsukamurella sp. 8F]
MPAPTQATFDRLRALAAIDTPESRESRDILEAFTGETIATVPIGTEKDVEVAFTRARAAQKDWAERPARERAKVLVRFADLVNSRRDELVDMIQAETGKARQYAQEETLDVAMTARWYGKNAPRLLDEKSVSGMLPVFTTTRVRYQPKGVIGVISPWNYPLTLAVSDAVAALAGGNAVVLKPDSQTPFCALAAAELLYQAGLPRDLFAVVPGPGGKVGTAIVEACDYLMFTGSSATGATLAEQCGRRLIGFSAELGGKNPMIVTADAPVEHTADGAARACFSNSGQLCISIERIYVERPVAEAFTRAFADRVARLPVGPGYDFANEMGSLASQAQIDTVAAHVDDAVAKGATVVAGGKARPDLGPFFYEPTVLADVTDDMTCYATETFGPLVSIYPVDSVDEAVERANDTEYGLNASVFAGSAKQAQAIAERVDAGTVNINEGYAAAWGSTAAPMGGMGISGVGRRHGAEGILKYMEAKTIARQRVIGLGGVKYVPRNLFLNLVPEIVKNLKYIGR